MLRSEVGGGGVAGEDLVAELQGKVGGEGVLLWDPSWSSTVLLCAVDPNAAAAAAPCPISGRSIQFGPCITEWSRTTWL